MGVVIPQVVTEDRASGALVVDGGLRFDSGKNHYLSRTPGSAGNRKTWTWSGWVKRSKFGERFRLIAAGPDNNNRLLFGFGTDDKLEIFSNTSSTTRANIKTNAVYRDPSAWYHVVLKYDAANTSADVYVNGVSQDLAITTAVANVDQSVSATNAHYIGRTVDGTLYSNGHLSNVYIIDGQALGPGYFGYTDPLTNTWRPKKFKPQATPNDGTLWSNSSVSGSWAFSDTLANAFDGNPASVSRAAASQATTITLIKEVPFTTSVKLTGSVDNAGGQIYVKDGTDTFVNVSSGFNASSTVNTVDITSSLVSPIKAIKLDSVGNGYARMSYLEIDGVALVDGDTSNIGVNGFHLPFDGSAPIGQDQSGRGNNWTPVNFGGSTSLDKATGALPILNTDGGGKVARPGVFGSEVSKYYTITGSSNSSTGYVFENEGTKPTLSMIRGTTHILDYTSATSHPLYLSSLSDGKHNAKAYSVSFDGTGDYLSLADSDDWNFGSGAFTVEGFAYFTGSASQQMIVGQWAGGGSQLGWAVMTSNNSSRFIRFLLSTTGSDAPVDLVSSTAFDLNKWNHFALTRSGNDFRLFIDGVLAASTTNSATLWNSTDVLTVGATSAGTQPFNGYISNLRVIKGTALYTENFTPPTTTLTNVTNTVLLCCQDSDATTAVVSPGAITANGDAAATNTYNPFLYDTDGYFGVDTSTSNVTKMTVPHYAPDTLYYYCNVHSGMGNSISVTTDTKKADPYAWKNVLGLPLVGNANDVSNQINSGSTTKTVTSVNAVASYTQSNFYGGSWYFDGSGDYLQTPDSTDFTMGSGDYTIEGWFYFNNLSATQRLFGQRASDASQLQFVAETNASGVIYYYFAIGDTNYQIEGNTLSTSQWNHIAIVRSGDIHTLYTNGVAVGLRTQSGSLDDRAQPFSIGRQGNYTPDTFNGYIQDFRVYKGVAKYTSNFIPASTNPDILPDTPSGVSYSSNVTKITDGAVSAAAEGDKLTISASSDFAFGTGDFTMECFAYRDSDINSYSRLIHFGPYWNNNDAIGINFDDGVNPNKVVLGAYKLRSTGSVPADGRVLVSSTDVGSNRWYHIAVTRESGVFKLWIDGKLEDTESSVTSESIESSSTNNFTIFSTSDSDDEEQFAGKISNVRIIKGTALYTSNFTPPTRALTAVANTKLLCCKSPTSATAFDVSPGTITSVNALATNFNPFTTDIDTQRGKQSGYCTLNPLASALNGQSFSNGNLEISGTHGNETLYFLSTIKVSSGKYYVEYDTFNVNAGKYTYGITEEDYMPVGAAADRNNGVGILGYAVGANSIIAKNTVVQTPTADTRSGIWGVAADFDNNQLSFFFNGVQVGTTISITAGNYAFAASQGTDLSRSFGVIANFGQKPFKFPPPEGFQPLTLANTPRPSIVRPDQYMGITTWTGDGATSTAGTLARTLSNLSFKPDLIWVKERTATGTWADNNLTDSVRGTGLALRSNTTDTETNVATGFQQGGIGNGVNNGFTIISGNIGGTNNVNNSGSNYVAWAWKAGHPSTPTTGAVSFDGSGDYLSLASSSDFEFSTGDFTVEFWYYHISGNDRGLFANNSGASVGVNFLVGAGGPFRIYNGTSANNLYDFSVSPTAKTWQHLAVVRNSGTLTLYVNGTSSGSTNWSGVNAGNTATFSVGSAYGNARYANGFISNFHVVKGTALYTSNFTPPTGPISSVANTKLLCCKSPTSATAFDVSPGTITSVNAVATTYNPLDAFSVDGTGYSTASAAGLTAGTITPTGASVNTKSGFSIITWTGNGVAGASVSHGLGISPSLIITKDRDATKNWNTYHKSLGATNIVLLNVTNASTAGDNYYNTTPTSTVFYNHAGNPSFGSQQNIDGNRYVSYCWAEIPGFSKFGSYSGNSDTSGNLGPYISLGFRPAWILIKTTSSGSWRLYDNQRNKFNPANTLLFPNLANGDTTNTTTYPIDFLSNGFKIRATDGADINATGQTYIYAAFAEAPSINLYGAQANAR